MESTRGLDNTGNMLNAKDKLAIVKRTLSSSVQMRSDMSHFNHCDLQQGSDAAKKSDRINKQGSQKQLVNRDIVIESERKVLRASRSGDQLSIKIR